MTLGALCSIIIIPEVIINYYDGVLIMAKLSAKQRMLNVLSQETGKNTFTVKQAEQRFKIANVSARIDELRKDGHQISTNVKVGRDGKKTSYYSM